VPVVVQLYSVAIDEHLSVPIASEAPPYKELIMVGPIRKIRIMMIAPVTADIAHPDAFALVSAPKN